MTVDKQRNSAIAGALRSATFGLWAFSSLSALTLGIVADVFQGERNQFPLAIVVGTGIGLNLVAVILMLALGKLTKKGFAVFQPFSGGPKFSLMQAAGYTLGVFAILAMIVLEETLADEGNGPTHPRYGVFTVLSSFAAFAQVLLVTSLLFFRAPSPATDAAVAVAAADKQETVSLRDITRSPAREYAFVAVCAAAMVVSAVLAEFYPQYRVVSVPIVLCFACVAMATVAYLGRRFAPTYRIVTLTSQTASLTVLQFFGNALLLLYFCGSVVLYNARQAAPPSWHLGVALIGVTGICCHELLLRLTRSRETEAAAAATALAEVAINPTSPLLRQFASTQEDRKRGSLKAAAMSTLVSFLLTVAVFAISVFISVHLPADAQPEVEKKVDPSVVQGLLQVQILLVVLLFAMPPFTHLQGRLVFGKGYEIWQPFKGSVEFVVLQAAAWASYAFAILFATLQASEPTGKFNFLFLLITALLLSQLFVHVSLPIFDETAHTSLFSGADTSSTKYQQPFPPDEDEDPVSPTEAAFDSMLTGSSPDRNGSRSAFPTDSGSHTTPDSRKGVSTRSLVAMVVNGELLLSVVLTVVSMAIRGVCDAVEQARAHGKTGAILRVPTKELVLIANLLSLLATPVAQLSMRHRIPFLHITSASVGFNILQTVAWLTYLSQLFLLAVSIVSGEKHFFTCSAKQTFMESTAQGLLLCLPLVCVVISNACEAQERLQAAARTVRVRRAADRLVSLLGGREDATNGEKRRVVELIRSIAGPRLSETDWGFTILSATAEPCDGSQEDSGAGVRPASALSDDAEHERIDDDEASVAAARYITAIMCLACTAAFSGAAFIADNQPVITLLLGVAGVIVLALTCVSLQYVLGYRLHGHTNRYALFMPFVGGPSFVFWQAIGWACYTLVACFIIACVVEGRGSPLAFFVMNVLSAVAQSAIFHSIPLFDAEAPTIGSGFVGKNVEGLLAAVILLGTFSFARAYDLAKEGSVSSNASALVPLVIMSIAVCLTVPMGLLSLQRQAEQYGASPLAFFDTLQESDSDDDDDDDDIESAEQRFFTDSCMQSTAAMDELRDTMSSSRGVETVEHGTSLAGSSGGARLWGPTSTSPALREGLIRHARTESLASLSAGNRSTHRASFSGAASTTSPRLAIDPNSPAPDMHTPMGRETSAFAGSSINWGSRRSRTSSYTIAVSYAVSLLVASFLALLLPFTVVLLGYSYAHHSQLTYAAGARTLEILVSCFALVVTVPMIVAPIARRSKAVRWVHSALCAWSIYSIPTITVLSGVFPPLIVNSRGAWLFAINMCSMALLSTVPYVHLTAFIFSVCCCGYFAQYHFYECLYLQKGPFILWKCVFDMICALFWLWYGRRYVGRPEVTGRYQNNAASRFFQRYFFEGMSHWFSLKVVLADLYLLPSERGVISLVEKHAEPQVADDIGLRSQVYRRVVDRSKRENQYLFSFHPHGVFPGTALYAPKTAQFERIAGANSSNFVSTHCADVVFSVPLMREFPMCLGSLSVGRAGIDHTIKAGNSPLIVTGGQSEMLLVQMSFTEMHLVCHHLGFVKVALRHKIPLVPMLSFSECNIMDNVHCLNLQRWFLKRIGFPFPTLPHGFMKLPLPTNTPMTLVVGPPLMPLPGRENWEDPACQEEMRIRYFSHLEYLFYRYRETAGYPAMQLYLHYGVDDAGVLATPPSPGIDVAKEYVLDEENAAIRRAIAANRSNRDAREAKRAASVAAKRAKEEEQAKKKR